MCTKILVQNLKYSPTPNICAVNLVSIFLIPAVVRARVFILIRAKTYQSGISLLSEAVGRLRYGAETAPTQLRDGFETTAQTE